MVKRQPRAATAMGIEISDDQPEPKPHKRRNRSTKRRKGAKSDAPQDGQGADASKDMAPIHSSSFTLTSIYAPIPNNDVEIPLEIASVKEGNNGVAWTLQTDEVMPMRPQSRLDDEDFDRDPEVIKLLLKKKMEVVERNKLMQERRREAKKAILLERALKAKNKAEIEEDIKKDKALETLQEKMERSRRNLEKIRKQKQQAATAVVETGKDASGNEVERQMKTGPAAQIAAKKEILSQEAMSKDRFLSEQKKLAALEQKQIEQQRYDQALKKVQAEREEKRLAEEAEKAEKKRAEEAVESSKVAAMLEEIERERRERFEELTMLAEGGVKPNVPATRTRNPFKRAFRAIRRCFRKMTSCTRGQQAEEAE